MVARLRPVREPQRSPQRQALYDAIRERDAARKRLQELRAAVDSGWRHIREAEHRSLQSDAEVTRAERTAADRAAEAVLTNTDIATDDAALTKARQAQASAHAAVETRKAALTTLQGRIPGAEREFALAEAAVAEARHRVVVAEAADFGPRLTKQIESFLAARASLHWLFRNEIIDDVPKGAGPRHIDPFMRVGSATGELLRRANANDLDCAHPAYRDWQVAFASLADDPDVTLPRVG